MKMHKYLRELLSIKRPSGGSGVERARYMICVTIDTAGYHYEVDDYGNIICTTNFNGVLYSSHIDTVHRSEGAVEVRMDDFGIVTGWHQTTPVARKGMEPVKATHERCVLGADDAAGIYIMLRMIEEGLPGTYVFHADEEIGCLGSRAIAAEGYSVGGYDLENDFSHAIAFDRKGTSDFIHVQLGEKMASQEFTLEMCARLQDYGDLRYTPAVGMITDTAMYADFVEECINLSVGYYDEHTEDERLDYGHLENLLEAIINNPWIFEDMPIVRELPVYIEEEEHYQPCDDYELPETIEGLVRDYPRAVASILQDNAGYDYNELLSTLDSMDVLV